MSSTATRSIEIPAPPEMVFDLVHDYARRLEWDPFLRRAELLGASRAGMGVAARCTARWGAGGLAMETVYVSFRRPNVAAVKMTRGPMFLKSFAASMRQQMIANGGTMVTYAFHFTTRPRFLSFLLDPMIRWVLQREVTHRLRALRDHFLAESRTPEPPSP